MDGGGEWGVHRRIVLPLLRPAPGAPGLSTFIASGNNFIGPLIVMRSADRHTLPLALRGLQTTMNTDWGAPTTGSAIATIPLPILRPVLAPAHRRPHGRCGEVNPFFSWAIVP